MKAIADGEIKEGTYIDVHDSGGSGEKIATILYTNEKLNWETGSFTTAYLCSKRYTFIVSEEQQDIDIQAIENLYEWVTRRNGEVTQTEGKILEIGNKLNKLIEAVKQLDRNINKE